MSNFIALGWTKIAEEDSFTEGLIGGCVVDSGNRVFQAATIDALIASCAKFCNQDDLKNCLIDSCDEEGRLDIQVYEDAEGMGANSYDLEVWQAGGRRLWLATYTFQILRAESVVINTLVADKHLYAEG